MYKTVIEAYTEYYSRYSSEIIENYSVKYNTEIHFITFWEQNNVDSIKRVENAIQKYNSEFIRIIKKIRIPKKDINYIFKSVGSGGKHNKHDIDIYIIEVPSEYKKHSTHDNPNGEMVNTYMYELKLAAREKYKRYKVAHGSFNIKEVNDFLKMYFKYLGEFADYNEVLYELNNSNLFWFYDRVDHNQFGKEADVDLVTDSIPAICFLLRSIKVTNKLYIKVNNKQKLFDLRDFNSNYYPKEWLNNIKYNNSIYLTYNNIKVPDTLNHFMLGLYHMYIHKNGRQSKTRINILENMGMQLGYNNLNKNILFDFLNSNNYKVKKPIDSDVGFFYKENYGQFVRSNIKYNNIIRKFNNEISYYNEKTLYQLTNNNKHFPKLLNYDDNKLQLELQTVGRKINLDKDHIPNWKQQINEIIRVLDELDVYHNDIHIGNLLLGDDGTLYIIDFEYLQPKRKYNKYFIQNPDNRRFDYKKKRTRGKVLLKDPTYYSTFKKYMIENKYQY